MRSKYMQYFVAFLILHELLTFLVLFHFASGNQLAYGLFFLALLIGALTTYAPVELIAALVPAATVFYGVTFGLLWSDLALASFQWIFYVLFALAISAGSALGQEYAATTRRKSLKEP